MGLGIPIFVTALLLSGAASLKIQAYFNETASLPCQFPNSQNRSLSELVIFWQDHENLVLYESYLGNEKSDNVNFKYKGRTSFDQSTWTLHLHHVQITEEGSYQCIVHHRGQQGLFPLHQKAADLSVVANFSKPEIGQTPDEAGNSHRNFTCSSRHGFPKPVKMSFLLEFENSTSEHNGNMQLSQDNSTGLFNVSISWSIPWSNGTGKATITCALKTTEMSLFSQPLGIVDKDSSPVSNKDQTLRIVAAALCLIFGCGIIMCVFILWNKKKKKKQPCSCSKETTRTKMEKKEEKEERMKINVPEGSDEAQCDTCSSKTSSGHKNTTQF